MKDVTQKHLIKVAKQLVNDWIKKLPEFVKWKIHFNENGAFTDLSYWLLETSDQNIEKEISHIPNAVK